MKVQTLGDATITPYRNTRAGTALTLTMTAETTSDAARRHRVGVNIQDQHISLRIRNNTAAQDLQLLEYGLGIYEKEWH